MRSRYIRHKHGNTVSAPHSLLFLISLYFLLSISLLLLLCSCGGSGAQAPPSAQDKALASEALEKMDIPHLAGEDFSRLSEGQKQLVILARTLVQEAPVMLMDEPDSSLDFPNKQRILSGIRQLIRSQHKAGLITLHDPNLALAHCDRLILLREGRVVSEIKLTGAGLEEVQSCLSLVYNDITLLEHDGKYIALHR